MGETVYVNSLLDAPLSSDMTVYAKWRGANEAPDGLTYELNASTGNYMVTGYTGADNVIRIPETYSGKPVTGIDARAFSENTAIIEVNIPDSVTSIGSSAFEGTAWYANQPDGVVYAGKVLYKYKGTMSSNTSITVKEGTLGIAACAFLGCSSLTSIVIQDGVTSISDNAFYGTAWYANQPDGVVYAGKVLYKYKGTMPSNTRITVKEGTLGITAYAFRDCSTLTSIVIPNSNEYCNPEQQRVL